jgi:DNA-binding MarR family transcriptional regulator
MRRAPELPLPTTNYKFFLTMPHDPDPVAKSHLEHAARVNNLLVKRLSTLGRILSRGASLSFQRVTDRSDFDWLVVSFVGAHEDPVFAADVAHFLIRDKAQVSRSLARLTETGMIARAHLRAPLKLTPSGEELFTELERNLKERNAQLLVDVPREERELLSRVLVKLYKGANTLLAEEMKLAGKYDETFEARGEIIPPSQARNRWSLRNAKDVMSPDWLVMPDLHLLLRLVMQSANMAFPRLTRLAAFEWLTISRIELTGPLTLTDLIEQLDRNKSQVGRAIARLTDLGLVSRQKVKGVSSAVLATTPAGKEVTDVITTEALRRDVALIENLTVGEYRALITALDRLTGNALNMLAHERAYKELSQD